MIKVDTMLAFSLPMHTQQKEPKSWHVKPGFKFNDLLLGLKAHFLLL